MSGALLTKREAADMLGTMESCARYEARHDTVDLTNATAGAKVTP